MKKINVLLLSALALGLITTSCSKNEEEKPSIVANWTFDTIAHVKAGTSAAETPYNNSSCSDKNLLNIKAAGKVDQQVVGDSTDPCAVNIINGTYTYENNIFHLEQDGSEIDLTVVSLTSTKLKLKMTNPDDAEDTYIFTLIR